MDYRRVIKNRVQLISMNLHAGLVRDGRPVRDPQIDLDSSRFSGWGFGMHRTWLSLPRPLGSPCLKVGLFRFTGKSGSLTARPVFADS